MSDKKVKIDVSSPTYTENGKPNEDNGADFETAILETKFGLFNVLLFFVIMPSTFAAQFGNTALSYVYPAAQCDLNLSLEDRGLINAMIYTGMIISCFLWGPLVDVFGRRRILYISHFMDSIFMIVATFAPNITVIIVAKFFGGFIINGPSMALTPYSSEFHGLKYRSTVPLMIGLLYNGGNIILPLLAWGILRLDIQLPILGLEFHAWNLFLFICSLPTFLSGILFILMPESPKYLMSKGNNEEALKTFKKIYKINTREAKENYPVTKLKDERQIYHKNHSFKDAWNQISPLFTRRYVSSLFLVCSFMFCLMMCINSLRLWLPDIFQLINDYNLGNNDTTSICAVLNTVSSIAQVDGESCAMNFDNTFVYINAMGVGSAAVAGYIAAALCVNKIGKKRLLLFLELVSAISVTSIYFTVDSMTAVILICIFLTCFCICVDIVITFIVDLFPTYLRGSALSLALMSGRIGSVLGNLAFPLLLRVGCGAVFFSMTALATCCIILALFLPKTDFKALE